MVLSVVPLGKKWFVGKGWWNDSEPHSRAAMGFKIKSTTKKTDLRKWQPAAFVNAEKHPFTGGVYGNIQRRSNNFAFIHPPARAAGISPIGKTISGFALKEGKAVLKGISKRQKPVKERRIPKEEPIDEETIEEEQPEEETKEPEIQEPVEEESTEEQKEAERKAKKEEEDKRTAEHQAETRRLNIIAQKEFEEKFGEVEK